MNEMEKCAAAYAAARAQYEADCAAVPADIDNDAATALYDRAQERQRAAEITADHGGCLGCIAGMHHASEIVPEDGNDQAGRCPGCACQGSRVPATNREREAALAGLD